MNSQLLEKVADELKRQIGVDKLEGIERNPFLHSLLVEAVKILRGRELQGKLSNTSL